MAYVLPPLSWRLPLGLGLGLCVTLQDTQFNDSTQTYAYNLSANPNKKFDTTNKDPRIINLVLCELYPSSCRSVLHGRRHLQGSKTRQQKISNKKKSSTLTLGLMSEFPADLTRPPLLVPFCLFKGRDPRAVKVMS